MRILPLAVLLAGLALPAWAEPAPALLSVTGEGLSVAAPDMATLSLGVSTQGKSAGASLAENSTLLAAVLDELAGMGVEARDIQTSGLSVSPIHDYSDSSVVRVVGYEARNMITVRVRDLPRLGALIDAAFAAGANEFNSVSFALENNQEALDAARRAAVADARARAELYAEAAGVRLGRIDFITEGGSFEAPMSFQMRAAPEAAPPVPVAEGELAISATVTIHYELVQ